VSAPATGAVVEEVVEHSKAADPREKDQQAARVSDESPE